MEERRDPSGETLIVEDSVPGGGMNPAGGSGPQYITNVNFQSLALNP